jgi:hypothetical protein
MVPCNFTFACERTKDSVKNLMRCNLCRTPKQGNRGSKVFYLEATDRQIPLRDEKKKSLKPNKTS